MRCAVYIRNSNTTPTKGSKLGSTNKCKPISVTKISSAHSADIVTVTDTNFTTTNMTSRHSTRHKHAMLHKPVKSEQTSNTSNSSKKGPTHKSTGGRHLQPPSANNSKLKHECPFEGCPWRFATPYKLRRHIKSHTKETPYQCKECGRGFSVRYNLLMHIQTIHSTPHKYKCPMADCKEAFHTQPRLNGHLRKVHKKDWKQLQLEQGQGNTAVSTPKKTSTTKSRDTPTDTPTDTPKHHKCIDCDKEFTSQAKLSAHMKTHSGSYNCTVQGCSKSFQTLDKLAKHLDTSHKSLPCPYKGCNRVFLKQSQLKNHIRIHANKYTCSRQDCNMKFDNEMDYNDHLNVHLGYSIQCPYKMCSLTFPTEKRLELHYRVAHLNKSEDTSLTSDILTQSDNTVPTATPTQNGRVQCSSDNFMDVLELPDLKVEDVEAVMSEHTNWTGDQIETFLKSLDIEELDCTSSLKSSLSGYESDSGYSTHEISPMCTGAQYSSALSPAITPVTPSPILSTSSSLPSPIPPTLCLYPHEEMFPQMHLPTTPTMQLSTTPINEHHFFPITDLSLLPSQCPPTSPDHVFPNTSVHAHQPSFQTVPPIISQAVKVSVQSVMPPVSNISADIEANRHDVTVVTNTYCNNNKNLGVCTSNTPTSATRSDSNTMAVNSPAHFDAFFNGYLNLSLLENDEYPKHQPDNNEDKCNGAVIAQRQVSTGNMASHVNNCDSDFNKVAIELSDLVDSTQNPPLSARMVSGCNNGGYGNSVDNVGVVIAQVLSPTKQGKNFSSNNNTSVRSSKSTRSSKARHHSASISMKGHQKGSKKKSNWPKSMNSGNLMAFRNFILGKLKSGPACSFSGNNADVKVTQSLPSTPSTFFGSLTTSDEFINFNPDVLLSSEQSMDSTCFSPFSHHSGSISPIPVSPSLESSVQFTSLSSLGSDLSPGPDTDLNGNLGIDGFIQCLSLDPISQGLDQSVFGNQLSDEFCSIFKTDADPLFGGSLS